MRLPFILLFLLTLTLSSCGVVEGIFKAGMWTAFLVIGLIVGIIIFFIAKARKK